MIDMRADHSGQIPECMKWCPRCNGYGSSLKEDASDTAALFRLGALDSPSADGRPPPGRGGRRVVAAVQIESGDAIVDPFRPSGELVDLLRLQVSLDAGLEQLVDLLRLQVSLDAGLERSGRGALARLLPRACLAPHAPAHAERRAAVDFASAAADDRAGAEGASPAARPRLAADEANPDRQSHAAAVPAAVGAGVADARSGAQVERPAKGGEVTHGGAAAAAGPPAEEVALRHAVVLGDQQRKPPLTGPAFEADVRHGRASDGSEAEHGGQRREPPHSPPHELR
jgi:hypothetical protein